ncbi:MAG: hypothetical protein ACE363_05475 [Alphaproteobacteria bacterium]
MRLIRTLRFSALTAMLLNALIHGRDTATCKGADGVTPHRV